MDKYSRKAVSKALVAQVLLCPDDLTCDFTSRLFTFKELIFDLFSWGPFPRWRVRAIGVSDWTWLDWKSSRQISKVWRKHRFEFENKEQLDRHKKLLHHAGYKNVE